MFRWLKDNWKNIGGWRTNRKLLVINVDDYGNVRLDSKHARDKLLQAGVRLSSRMDLYDSLETREDLELLFDVLSSVRDRSSQPAKFTAYVLSANPNFDLIRSVGKYCWELLPETFHRLACSQPSAYTETWKLWQEGVTNGLIRPQFHGREHLNLTLLNRKLEKNDADLIANLENESMAGLESDLPGIGFTQAFAITPTVSLEKQVNLHTESIRSGMDAFERVFGFRSKTFTPPAQTIHPRLYGELETLGIQGIDKPYRCCRELGNGKRVMEKNRLGTRPNNRHLTIVRNVVFEPADEQGFDPVDRALLLVETAFRWGKPAIISSHRVNFCGHIDPNNRARGLAGLKRLLDAIVLRWPDIEFVTADELVQIIVDSHQ